MRTATRWTCLFLLALTANGWCQEIDFSADDDQDERVRRIVEERRKQEEAAARLPTSLDGGVTVNPAILEPILDKTMGLRFEERDAYFRILELAHQTPLSDQQSLAWDFREARRISNPRHVNRKPELFPTLVDVINNPEVYRGRPVTLHGLMRKLTKFDPGQNNRGITEVYEAWIYTEDSHATAIKRSPKSKEGEKNARELEEVIVPSVVVFQGKPEGLSVGGDLAEEVRFTGYFFKLYQYESQDRFTVAPLFLAGKVQWRESPEPYKPKALPTEVYLMITMAFAVIAFVWWQGNRREMSSSIRPAEADFRRFPPVELPRSSGPEDRDFRINETHDE